MLACVHIVTCTYLSRCACVCVGFFPAGDFPSLSQPTGVPLEQLHHIGTVFSSPPEGITLHAGQQTSRQ